MKPPPLDVVIDISHYQGEPDFAAVEGSGIRAMVHKCTQGVGWSDDMYDTNIKVAEAVGLYVAAYHFGTNLHSGLEQARYFLENCLHVRACLDYEQNGSSTMTLEQAEQFCRTVEAATKKPTMVYAGANMFPDAYALRFSCFGERPLWFPQYGTSPSKAPRGWRVTMWQYTDDGSVPGVAGPCDRSKFYGTRDDLLDLFTP